ncbi:MAG TPA: SRPBCC family protein [Streptosporangiaceae bacterium]
MKTVNRRLARTCSVELIVDASVESVWRVIADVTRTSEWSHECHRVAWLGGAAAAAPGVRFRGGNQSGWLRWSRICEVLAVDPPRQIAWRTVPGALMVDSTVWRISLEPAGTGTRIAQSFQLTKCPRWWARILARVNPGHIDRGAALTEDLRRLGEVAAADVRAVEPAG